MTVKIMQDMDGQLSAWVGGEKLMGCVDVQITSNPAEKTKVILTFINDIEHHDMFSDMNRFISKEDLLT